MLLKAHEVMTHDRRIKYLGRQYLKVHTHGRRGIKVRLPQEYFDSIATAMEIAGCGVNAQLQDAHAQSSVESEFYALGAGYADGLYVKAILDDLGMRAKINLRSSTRHVKVKYLYVQDLVKAREVEVSRVATETNLADVGTKHVPSHGLEFLKSLMGKSSENVMTFQSDITEQFDGSEEKSDEDQHG